MALTPIGFILFMVFFFTLVWLAMAFVTWAERRIKQKYANSEKSQQEKCGDTLTHQHRHGTHPEEGQVSKENDMATVDNTLSELNEVGK